MIGFRAEALAVILAGLVNASPFAPGAAAAPAGCPGAATTCSGSDATATSTDTYRGFVWRNSAAFYKAVRWTGSDCAECVWSVANACSAKLPSQDQGTCVGGQLRCPPDTPQRVLWLSIGGAPRELVEAYCPAKGTKATKGPPILDLTAAHQKAERSITAPAPQIGTSPPAQLIVNLASYFYVTLPRSHPQTIVSIAGAPELRLQLTLTPDRITWDFGDGHTMVTTDPGKPYPNGHVLHTFTALGARAVHVTQSWTGTSQVLTPYGPMPARPYPTPFTSQRTRVLDVTQLRAFLTTD